MLSLDDLKFFQVVAGSRSLAAVARALDVTAPAVSQRLAAIERRVNARLVERARDGLCLTDEGQIIAESARNILESLDELASVVAARRGELEGPLRVAAPLGFGRTYVAPLVSAFHAAHPGIVIDLVLGDRAPDPGSRIDLTVYIGELRQSAAVVTKIAPNDRLICASPDYLARYGVPASADDLSRHRCIALRENDEDSTLWRFVHRGQTLSIRVKPVLASNDGEVARTWALEGNGIIVRSEWHVADDIRAGTLVRILDDYRPPSANVVALLGTSRARSARTEKFLAHLRAGLTPAPWRRA